MTALQRHAIHECLRDLADQPGPEGVPAGENTDYIFCLWVERWVNGVREMGIPWEEVHAEVMAWLAGEAVSILS